MPESLYRILPLIMILAAIAFFMALARSSELVVIRATGRSGLRLLMTPVLSPLLIGVLAVMVLNPIGRGTIKQYDELVTRYANGESSVLSIRPKGSGCARAETGSRWSSAPAGPIRMARCWTM